MHYILGLESGDSPPMSFTHLPFLQLSFYQEALSLCQYTLMRILWETKGVVDRI